MGGDASYGIKRLPTRVYFSREFEDEDGRRQRFGYRVFDEEERPSFIEIDGEITLRSGPTDKQQVKLLFYTDDRSIKGVIIQRFRVKDGRPIGRNLLHLTGDEVLRLTEVLDIIKMASFQEQSRISIDEDALDLFSLSDTALRFLARERSDVLAEVVRHDLRSEDVIALAYRKEQLQEFERLLDDDEHFDARAATHPKRSEGVWQEFFELNPWILGHGLTLVFSRPLKGRNLEQVTSGFSIAGVGKRVDALLRTQGFVSSLCFGELKTHRTELTRAAQYRSGVWAPSDELAAGVAQSQMTVQRAVEDIRRKFEPMDSDGVLTGEMSYVLKPRSVLVIGNLREFQRDKGLQENRYASFELFRRSVLDPEIITYDELLARAKSVVEASAPEDDAAWVDANPS